MVGSQTTDNAASDSMKETRTLSSPAGNGRSELNPGGTLRTKGCVIDDGAIVPRMGLRTQNTELGRGPAQSYNTKSAIDVQKQLGQ